MSRFFVALIQVYRRYISPGLGYHCRFMPTCSEYAEEAIHKKGLFRGLLLSTTRLMKCHPFHPGGLDPVE